MTPPSASPKRSPKVAASGHGGAKAITHSPPMVDEVRTDIQRRLATARGHLDAVLRMLGEGDPSCVDVMRQLRAVSGALDKTVEIVLEGHLRHHVARAGGEPLVRELMDALRYR